MEAVKLCINTVCFEHSYYLCAKFEDDITLKIILNINSKLTISHFIKKLDVKKQVFCKKDFTLRKTTLCTTIE